MSSMWERESRRDSGGGLAEKASKGGAITPRRPVLWLGVQLYRAARWMVRSFAFGASLLFTTWTGRAVAGVAAVLMLVDATFGSDPVTIPLVGGYGWLLLILAGSIAWRKRKRWEEHMEGIVYEAVPGHSRSFPPVVWYPPHAVGKLVQLGRWLGKSNFSFRVPGAVRESGAEEVAEHLRSRLPAAEGSSWDIAWDWRRGVCHARIVRDLPSMATRPIGEVSADPEMVPLGLSRGGEAVWPLDNNFGNILVTGGPGGGKSVVANGIVRHCIEHRRHFDLYGIDMKGGVELAHLTRHKNVRRIAEDLDSSVDLLQRIRAEVDKRQAALRATETKKIGELNSVRKARGEKPMKRLILVVDELAELTDTPDTPGKSPEEKEEAKQRGECKALLDSIIRLGRAGGVHVVAALQRPDIRYMTGAMRSNIQMRVATGRLDQSGCQMVESKLAGELPGISGRGVLWRGGQEEIVQYYYTAEGDLDEVAKAQAAAAKAAKANGKTSGGADPSGSANNGDGKGGGR